LLQLLISFSRGKAGLEDHICGLEFAGILEDSAEKELGLGEAILLFDILGFVI
jgi:hypothetical protein